MEIRNCLNVANSRPAKPEKSGDRKIAYIHFFLLIFRSIQRFIVPVSLHQTSLAGCGVSLAAVCFAKHVFVHVQVFTAALKV